MTTTPVYSRYQKTPNSSSRPPTSQAIAQAHNHRCSRSRNNVRLIKRHPNMPKQHNTRPHTPDIRQHITTQHNAIQHITRQPTSNHPAANPEKTPTLQQQQGSHTSISEQQHITHHTTITSTGEHHTQQTQADPSSRVQHMSISRRQVSHTEQTQTAAHNTPSAGPETTPQHIPTNPDSSTATHQIHLQAASVCHTRHIQPCACLSCYSLPYKYGTWNMAEGGGKGGKERGNQQAPTSPSITSPHPCHSIPSRPYQNYGYHHQHTPATPATQTKHTQLPLLPGRLKTSIKKAAVLPAHSQDTRQDKTRQQLAYERHYDMT
jgi:hypothetical protein